MSINERSRQLAAEANEKAKEYHQARTTETAHSFEDLAMDQPLPRDHTDPGNSSWIDTPKGQCQVLLAKAEDLPVLDFELEGPKEGKHKRK